MLHIKMFQVAHKRWCENEKDPEWMTTIKPLDEKTLRGEQAELIVDRVADKLLNQGIKNLLGSVRENLKMLVPLVLEELKEEGDD